MKNIGEVEKLYKEGKYKEIKEMIKEEDFFASSPEGAKFLILLAWAKYQLGEYEPSFQIFIGLVTSYDAQTEIGESARRGAAHALLQETGDIKRADKLLQEIPVSLSRENLRATMFLTAARKGTRIPFEEIASMILTAVDSFSGEVVNAHIVNNGGLALYEARKYSTSKKFLLEIAELLQVALVMYKIAGAADNHLAGILYRISLVFETAGDIKNALQSIKKSVNIWKKLVSTQGGERYQNNLNNAISKMEML